MSVFAFASLIALPRCALTSLMNAWIWLSCAFTLPRACAAAAAFSFAQSEVATPLLLENCCTSVQRLDASLVTVKVKLAVRVLPALSAQRNVTLTGTLGQPSPFAAGVAVPLIVGGVVSMTVMVCVADALLKLASVAT